MVESCSLSRQHFRGLIECAVQLIAFRDLHRTQLAQVFNSVHVKTAPGHFIREAYHKTEPRQGPRCKDYKYQSRSLWEGRQGQVSTGVVIRLAAMSNAPLSGQGQELKMLDNRKPAGGGVPKRCLESATNHMRGLQYLILRCLAGNIFYRSKNEA